MALPLASLYLFLCYGAMSAAEVTCNAELQRTMNSEQEEV
jgi:hypothetical protein